MHDKAYDYSPLNDKVTLGQLFSFGKLSIGLKIGISIAIVAIIMPIIALIASPAMRIGGLYMIGIFFAVVMAIVISMLIHRAKHIKVQRFAERNRMLVTRGIDLVHRLGAPFQMQFPTNDSIAITTPDTHAIEIGNFIATGRNGMSSPYGSFGFIRFVLPREFPHIILDAKASDVVTRSTATPLSQYMPDVIRLEGDFPDTFHVYAPTNYDSDTRYILPPNFMAYLVDNAGAFDIEIINNELYIYSVDFFTLDKPAELKEIFNYSFEFQQALQHYLVPYVDWRADKRLTSSVASTAKYISEARPKIFNTFGMLLIAIALYYAARYFMGHSAH